MQAFSTEEELTKCFLDLRKYPNVIGIDGELQPKIKDGKILNSLAIRVYVSKKIPRDQFRKRNVISKIFNKHLSLEDLIPETINGYPVDVVEMGEVHSLDEVEVVAPRPVTPRQKTQLRYRPLLAGTSATHYRSTACTLNCLFIENGTGRLLMASNNHCFGKENTAKVGDSILQPSPYDGGIEPIDKIGEFYKCIEIKFIQVKNPIKDFFLKIFKTFRPEEAFFNRVDIAFASFIGCSNCPKCNPITNICLVKIYGIGLPIGKKLPNLNQRVQKVGRTTGVTVGSVVSTSWTGTVKYSRGSATFIDCILVSGKNFSLGGDSGSPVLDMNSNYIGTLFAGSGNHSIICKYTNIEKEGNCELVILPPQIKVRRIKESKRRLN
jgi:hypothetical protein